MYLYECAVAELWRVPELSVPLLYDYTCASTPIQVRTCDCLMPFVYLALFIYLFFIAYGIIALYIII